MSSKTKVVIIGAGPTGLAMAAQLLRYNIDCVILEKNTQATPLSKAVVVQARSLEIFQQMGLAQKAVKEGRITTALNMFYKGKRKVSVDIAGLGDGLTPFPFALSLEQSKTEKLLGDHLSAHGQSVRWGCEFLRFGQNKDGVTAYYKDGAGETQSIDAQYIVGCDGAHSPVRHAMGTSFEGDTVPKIFYITDVTLESPVINKDELFIFLIKKGFVLFFPMEGKGHYRIVGILTGANREDADFKFEEIEAFIKAQIVSPVEFKEVRWFSTYKVHSRMAGTFRKDRCFIAGDAAHIHTPAGGQGMNTGIQDAYNLAWKLAYVIDNKLDPSILESYNTERMGNARHLLRTTDRMFEVMSGTNPFWNFIRLHVMPSLAGFVTKRPAVKKQIFPLLSQIGIAYPQSSLSVSGSIGGISAGDRMPYFVFSNGKSVYDDLNTPGFKRLFFGNNPNGTPATPKELNFDIPLFSYSEIPQQLFGSSTSFYILLRPDNHISYIGTDLSACNRMLEKISATSPAAV